MCQWNLNTPRIVRNILEAWVLAGGAKGADGALFSETRWVLVDEMEAHGEDEVYGMSENIYRVPGSVQKFTKILVQSMGWVGGTESMRPFTVATEMKMITAMRDELETLGVRVSQNLDHNWMGFNNGKVKTMLRAMPILRVLAENKKVIMAPQCRYLHPCCSNKNHCTNCQEDFYPRKMLEGIKDIRRELNYYKPSRPTAA
jgi:hypothetical protein